MSDVSYWDAKFFIVRKVVDVQYLVLLSAIILAYSYRVYSGRFLGCCTCHAYMILCSALVKHSTKILRTKNNNKVVMYACGCVGYFLSSNVE
jgi:hypothetical protein